MNIKLAKTIPIEQILFKIGLNPQKTNGFESWYLSPFTIEKTASFKVNQKINRWFCHSSGFGGNAVDFTVKYFNYTVSDALIFLSDFKSSFSSQKQILNSPDIYKNENSIIITKISSVQHIALKQYLNSRNIINPEIQKQLKEIHYTTVNHKNYFGLGFKNDSDAWEIRSKYSKICIGRKDIRLIKNGNTKLRIFEGFFDYLSFIQINTKTITTNSDYLILNSVAMILKNKSILLDYETTELFLDNDATGDKYTQIILDEFKNAIDFRVTYSGYKDLNESIINREITTKN